MYKALLSDGTTFAVKHLSTCKLGEKELWELCHPNLFRSSFCRHNTIDLIIVYSFFLENITQVICFGLSFRT
ncbi:hypothetical protein YC2023_061294 [Brassica napus]